MNNKKNIKLGVFIGLIALVLIMNHYFGLSEYLSNTENLMFLKNMASANILQAGMIYTVITMIGCVVLGLPGVVFAILAGLVFGPLWGSIFCSVATTIGAGIAFLVGRFFLKDSIKPMIEKNKYLRKLLFDESDKNAKLVLMITRLVPLFPYNLQNFAYGITNIKFWPFMIYSFIFMLPGTAMFTIASAGFVDEANRMDYIVIASGLAVLVFGIGYFLKKKHLHEENDELTGTQDGR